MRRLIALALSTALVLPGCASHTVTPQTTPARNTDADRQVLVSYVMQLPVGTRVKVTATYDNSAGNKANPDPTKLVHWGQQTYDEMMIGYIEYFLPISSSVAAR